MNLSESPTGDPQPPEPVPTVPPPRAVPVRPDRAWALALAGAVVAGAVAAGIYEATPTIFIAKPHMVRMMGQMVNQPLPKDVLVADRKNAVVAFGIAGALFGMLLGVAGGLARGSGRGALVGAVAGLVLGAAVGAGAGPLAVTTYMRTLERDSELITRDLAAPLMIHAGIWAALGAAGAAGLGIGAGAWRRLPSVILGGLVGGAIGSGLFDVVGALVWPDGRTYQIFAGRWFPRLAASMIPLVVAAAVAVSGLVSPGRPVKPAARSEV